MKITKGQLRRIIREEANQYMSVDEAQDKMIRFEQIMNEIGRACSQIAMLNQEAEDIAWEFAKYPYDDELAKDGPSLWGRDIEESLAQMNKTTFGTGFASMKPMLDSIKESIAYVIANPVVDE